MNVSVILPAAGLGTRMAKPPDKTGASRKQFLQLEGSPILIHTIRKFVSCASVTEIVVALRADDIEWVREMIEREHFAKPVRLVEGGDTRQDSVKNALATLGSGETDHLVAVHDAVRPFVDPATVDHVIAEAALNGAAIVGIVPVDTVKEAHKNKVRATLPREHLILTQTPQVFRLDLLREAYAKAEADGFHGTDESSLVERLESVQVSIVMGSDRNIKITRPNDIEIAKLFLAAERAASAVPPPATAGAAD
jgi:2-C-methyl-D-erythritol 4-phosphate cytidylyltransferase